VKKLPVSKQITFGLIVAGVAAVTSFLLAFMVAASSRGADQPAPSPLIGLCLGVVAGAMYLGLSGNRRVTFADDAARRAALAPVGDGTARLLVYRQGFIGKLAGVDVHVDGEVRTQLKSPRFAALEVSPGPHTLVSEVHNKRSRPLALTVSANEIAAVQIVVSLFGKTRLMRQDVEAVRPKLAQMPMVQA
jgi:hypothetical protein